MIRLSFPSRNIQASIPLPASKSESNRALVIAALCSGACQLSHLASARDTRTMQRLLDTDQYEWDVLDAGTTMRFLTAFATATSRETRMTGTPRMQQRAHRHPGRCPPGTGSRYPV